MKSVKHPSKVVYILSDEACTVNVMPFAQIFFIFINYMAYYELFLEYLIPVPFHSQFIQLYVNDLTNIYQIYHIWN